MYFKHTLAQKLLNVAHVCLQPRNIAPLTMFEQNPKSQYGTQLWYRYEDFDMQSGSKVALKYEAMHIFSENRKEKRNCSTLKTFLLLKPFWNWLFSNINPVQGIGTIWAWPIFDRNFLFWVVSFWYEWEKREKTVFYDRNFCSPSRGKGRTGNWEIH